MGIIFLLLLSSLSFAQLELRPNEYSFYDYQNGNYLELFTDGIQNTQVYGFGGAFGLKEKDRFQEILQQKTDRNYQWVLRELNSNTIISQSSNPLKQFYGASVSKVFVAGAYLNFSGGHPSFAGIQSLNDMIIVSSNSAWGKLQVELGEGNEDVGRSRINEFLKGLGITKSIGYRGYLNGVHGNEVNARDFSIFIQASFDGKYAGSKHLFKTMFLSRTGEERGRKYFPILMNIGGKTGTYDGETSVNGIPIISQSKHHSMVFEFNNKFYSLTVLSDPGTDEDIAVICGGLLRSL